MRISTCLCASLLFFACVRPAAAGSYGKWVHGPPDDPAFFPLAVWLQSPANAERYRQAGINTYVGLWRGPTEEQIAALKKAGMRLICEQNQTGLRHQDDSTIIGWMHGDEPDNAQAIPGRSGWGPPITPEKIVREYDQLRAADPSRPVMLNLGQGVAWDRYYGRGSRSNHPEDYPEYIKGCDIVSFDIYPVVHENPQVAGKLEFVARGVDRLVSWAAGKKIVWNCLECTHISNPDRKATPAQVRAEAWMSLIHGSQGLIYFVHQFKPRFREAALLDDPEMLEAVTRLNHQITGLAPVLNSPSLSSQVTVTSSESAVPVHIMAKKSGAQIYIFAIAMGEHETDATFTLESHSLPKNIDVLDENRSISRNSEGHFKDHFEPWQVHLYVTPAETDRVEEGHTKVASPAVHSER